MALISNIVLLTAEVLTGELNEKEPTFNEEPSPDNDKVIALYLIPPPNGAGVFNDIGCENTRYVRERIYNTYGLLRKNYTIRYTVSTDFPAQITRYDT